MSADPGLVQGITSGATVSTYNVWEPNRDVLDYKENSFGATSISKFDYTVNSMGRRSGLAESGSAYSNLPSVAWGYNSRGEVTLHDHTTPAYESVYEFDTIGNRTKAAGGTTLPGSPNHTVNSRNQYTTIGGVSPGYDDDGNLTSDAGGNTHGSARTYQWDAQNQLRQVSSGAVAAYRYDPHGRRISKTAGGSTTWFLYDGWNLIAEYQSGTLTRTHLWGLDLSGTTQGAGGVGGLLCTSIGGTKYYPLYDGNGNICQYLDGSGGIAAHYEYSPFGHLLNTPGTGSTPVSFNFRFSTKFNDSETDFYYYGYRYYSSWMGRWINRDPIAEKGGINLYAMVKNNAIGYVDYLGMQKRDCNWLIIVGHGYDFANIDSNAQKLIKSVKPKDCDKLGFTGCHRKSMNNMIEKLHKGQVLPSANRENDQELLQNKFENPFVKNRFNTGTLPDDGVEFNRIYHDTKNDAKKEINGECCKSVTIKIECTSDDFKSLYPEVNPKVPAGDTPFCGKTVRIE
jgi:RHS repeat-associated protein